MPRDGGRAHPQLQEDPECRARTAPELPGSADQLQPARPRTRNTDEALPKQRASGGAASAARPWGAQRRSPRSPASQPVLPHAAPSPAASTSAAGSVPQPSLGEAVVGTRPCLLASQGRDRAVLCPNRRRAKETEAFPRTLSGGTLFTAEFSHSQALGSALGLQHPAQPETANHISSAVITLSGHPNRRVHKRQYPHPLH